MATYSIQYLNRRESFMIIMYNCCAVLKHSCYNQRGRKEFFFSFFCHWTRQGVHDHVTYVTEVVYFSSTGPGSAWRLATLSFLKASREEAFCRTWRNCIRRAVPFEHRAHCCSWLLSWTCSRLELHVGPSQASSGRGLKPRSYIRLLVIYPISQFYAYLHIMIAIAKEACVQVYSIYFVFL